jgi:transposase
MAKQLVSDDGIGFRAANGSTTARSLSGILFVLRTGIPSEYLRQEMGCGSGVTCWRRLREWQQAGVWQRLHELLLARLQRRS